MDLNRQIGDVTPREAFEFFAASKHMNLPAMYASGYGDKRVITVVARDCNREFPISQFDKAIELYRAVLEELGYLEGDNA